MSNSEKKTRKLPGRILKILAWTAGIFIVLLLVLYLAVMLLFPPEKIKQLATEELSAALKRRVSIEKVQLNIFKGIEIQNFVVYESDSLRAIHSHLNSEFISINHIFLKYSLLSLPKRILIIKGIQIDSPEIQLFADNEGRFNFDDIIGAAPAPTETAQAAPPDTTPASAEEVLPVTIDLKKFELKNLSFTVDMLQDTTNLQIRFGSLSGTIHDLHLPRGSEEDLMHNIRATVDFFMENAQLGIDYSSKPDTLAFRAGSSINMSLKLNVSGLQQIDATGNLALQQSHVALRFETEPVFPDNLPLLPELAAISFQFTSNLDSGLIKVNQLAAYFANQLVFRAEGTIENFIEEPLLDLHLKESHIQLDTLMAVAQHLAPPEFRDLLADLDINGSLSISGTQIKGNPAGLTAQDGLSIDSQIKFRNVNVDYARGMAQIKNLNFTANARGVYSEAGLSNTMVNASMKSPQLRVNPDDTLQFVGNHFELTAQAKLADNMFPTMLTLKSTIDDIFDSFIDIDLKLTSKGSFDDFEANGNIGVSGVRLQTIAEEDIAGIANFKMLLFSNSLDRITLDFTTALDSLMLNTGTIWEELDPLNLEGRLSVSTDTTLTNFYLAPSSIHLSNLLSLRLQGKVLDYGEQGFEFNIDSVEIDHRAVLDRLPDSYREGIESLDISGKTRAEAHISGVIPAEGEVDFDMTARVTHDRIDVDFPDVFLTIDDIAGDSRLRIQPDGLRINSIINIPSLILADVRPTPVRNSSILFEASMPQFETLDIQSCSLKIPDLKNTILITGNIDSLATEPELHFIAQMLFSSDSPCPIIEDLALKGNSTITAAVYMKKELLAVSGELGLNNLDVHYTDSITVYGIQGNIPFVQKVNVDSLILINEEALYASANYARNLGYEYMKPYYENLHPSMPRITIRQIDILKYLMDDFSMDISIGGGRLEVPSFKFNMFEGNVAGKFSIQLPEVTFENPDLLLDSTRLHLKATLSSINSAKLNPAMSVKAQYSRINANLELTSNGLNPEGNFEITGGFYITDIGPRVADNALRMLAPNDVLGIGVVRGLIRNGFKPLLMSFEIKHEHFYPKIELSQPWYFPVKIKGRKVELARMPIKLFLAQAMAPAY
ncbi:AsmA family protein [candidate division KSB1 bacterium]|nr:AsmA family protein [candidate division KSB1 bacterium]